MYYWHFTLKKDKSRERKKLTDKKTKQEVDKITSYLK